MILYHFTGRETFEGIREHGLTPNVDELGPAWLGSVVWLTADPDPGEPIDDPESSTGTLGFRVNIQLSDHRLKHWNTLLRREVLRRGLQWVTSPAHHLTERWYIFKGVIRPERLTELVVHGREIWWKHPKWIAALDDDTKSRRLEGAAQ